MPEVVIIADDLSGAADSGVSFAVRGYQTLVIWDFSDPPPVDVLVLSTESRHIPKDEAVAKVQNTAIQLSNLDDSTLIYKKIDSTLRGHPGAELSAVMAGFGISKALVAPAFPAQNRVTVSGIQYVNGRPLDQTSFGKEVKTAHIRDLFREQHTLHDIQSLELELVHQGIDAIKQSLQHSPAQLFIADAETLDDLLALVRGARAVGIRLFCGSAGLAFALSQTLACKNFIPDPMDSHSRGTGILGIIASRRANTVQQIAYAKARGTPIVCPDVSWFMDPSASVSLWAQTLQGHLSTHGGALLTAHELPDLPGKSALICSRLAEVAKTVIGTAPPAGLVLTGGDMVYALSTALKAQAIILRGEVQPGIPWGNFLGGHSHGCAVVTKAGGFGNRTVLMDALRFFKF